MKISIRNLVVRVYISTIGKFKYHFKLYRYWVTLPRKIETISRKERIKVLFVVSEARSWKSEALYLAMKNHERFYPVVGVSTNQSFPQAKKGMIDYLIDKGYEYYDLDAKPASISFINPDLLFYYAPYDSCYSQGHFFYDNLDYVFCGIDYCLAITKHVVHLVHPWFDYCWQFYVEHNDVAIRKKEILGYRARNIKVTGVPMQDILLQPKECFVDPWKDKTGKKRIIYAPHHSIKGTNGDGIEFATFLEFGESIMELANKYSDSITIAFKPHGTLYAKLIKAWGKEKTEAYYKKWGQMPNTQYEDGDYVSLFKYSDAIIHDCASFIIEYLYMDKPSMFLVSESNSIEDMFGFVQKGYMSYEHGKSLYDIEEFIKRVITGVDVKKEERHNCIQNELMPPGGKFASENIINEILSGLQAANQQ